MTKLSEGLLAYNTMEVLFTYKNGSKLIKTTMRYILDIDNWNGNRILDKTHVESIKNSLRLNGKSVHYLDNGYHIVCFDEKDAGDNLVPVYKLVDGQHRREVVREMIELCDDFPVTAIIKNLDNESEAIQYFNTINHSKPIQIDLDPKMIINPFIAVLVEKYPKMIKSTNTKSPYLSVDILRQDLEKYITKLKKITPKLFCEKVDEWNKKEVTKLELEMINIPIKKKGNQKTARELAYEYSFALNLNLKLQWINSVLSSV
jgi:hypothetical protein